MKSGYFLGSLLIAIFTMTMNAQELRQHRLMCKQSSFMEAIQTNNLQKMITYCSKYPEAVQAYIGSLPRQQYNTFINGIKNATTSKSLSNKTYTAVLFLSFCSLFTMAGTGVSIANCALTQDYCDSIKSWATAAVSFLGTTALSSCPFIITKIRHNHHKKILLENMQEIRPLVVRHLSLDDAVAEIALNVESAP